MLLLHMHLQSHALRILHPHLAGAIGLVPRALTPVSFFVVGRRLSAVSVLCGGGRVYCGSGMRRQDAVVHELGDELVVARERLPSGPLLTHHLCQMPRHDGRIAETACWKTVLALRLYLGAAIRAMVGILEPSPDAVASEHVLASRNSHGVLCYTLGCLDAKVVVADDTGCISSASRATASTSKAAGGGLGTYSAHFPARTRFQLAEGTRGRPGMPPPYSSWRRGPPAHRGGHLLHNPVKIP